MDRQEFENLFHQSLLRAALNADQQLGRRVPRAFLLKLYGCGHSGDLLTEKDVVSLLYLGIDLFYRIIDVAIIEISENISTVFVRVSDHTPGRFCETWNQPPGSGPFKQLIANRIRVP